MKWKRNKGEGECRGEGFQRRLADKQPQSECGRGHASPKKNTGCRGLEMLHNAESIQIRYLFGMEKVFFLLEA